MKRLAMASVVLAIAGIGATVVTTPAQAQTGRRCGFSSEFDPTLEGDTQTGEIHGGPLFSADPAHSGEEAAEITILCELQVGSQGATYAGAAAAGGTGSASGTGVAVLEPRVVSYIAPFGAPVYLCTTAIVGTAPNAETRYYDADDAANPTDFVGWTTSNTADCALALYQDGGFSGRCSISDPRLLCRTDAGVLCLIWSGGTCLVPLPGL